MPPIAREFNYSETTFVLPPDDPNHTAKVRIFTPGRRVAVCRSSHRRHRARPRDHRRDCDCTGDETRIVFEEGVGPVPVMIRSSSGRPTFAQLSVAKLPRVGPPPPSRETARRRALALDLTILLDGGHDAGRRLVRNAFPVRSRSATAPPSGARASSSTVGSRARPATITNKVFVFAMDAELAGYDVRARMFAPTHRRCRRSRDRQRRRRARRLSRRARPALRRHASLDGRAGVRDGTAEHSRGRGRQDGRQDHRRARRRTAQCSCAKER